jgi:hypothetical protein
MGVVAPPETGFFRGGESEFACPNQSRVTDLSVEVFTMKDKRPGD